MWRYPATLAHRLSPAEERPLLDFPDLLLPAAPAGALAAVRVFGSRARGGPGALSDLDVAVLLRPGWDAAPIQALATDAAFRAAEALDALDLGLSVLLLGPGVAAGVRGAMERDGFDLWRA